jgi:hypothetical protein
MQLPLDFSPIILQGLSTWACTLLHYQDPPGHREGAATAQLLGTMGVQGVEGLDYREAGPSEGAAAAQLLGRIVVAEGGGDVPSRAPPGLPGALPSAARGAE